MLGFIIGTACLIALVKLLRRGSCGRGYGGWGGGCHGGWGGPRGRGYRDRWEDDDAPRDRGFGWGRRWGGPGFFLRGLLEHVDATPAQEKVIAESFREVRAEGAKWRDELRRSRADIAKAMRAEGFDEVVLGELFARHDTAIEALRRAATGALAKVHAVLDEEQRARVADLIENGPGYFRSRRRRGFDL